MGSGLNYSVRSFQKKVYPGYSATLPIAPGYSLLYHLAVSDVLGDTESVVDAKRVAATHGCKRPSS